MTVVATYTTDDDGIHLECECGWSIVVGYRPSVANLAALADAHNLREHA